MSRGMVVLCFTAMLGSVQSGCYRPALPPQSIPAPSRDGGALPPESAPFRGSQPSTSTVTPHDLEPLTFDVFEKPEGEPRAWRHIVLHHTATDQGSVESIHEAHLRRKDKNGRPWQGIGYHFVIGNGNGMGDGRIEETFRWREQMHGAHAGVNEYNQHGIGIVLVGNFEETSPSPAQLAAVKSLVAALKAEYGVSAANVVPHGDLKATACPGKFFPMDEIAHASTGFRLGRRRLAAPALAARETQQTNGGER